jgi:hypothetical protein
VAPVGICRLIYRSSRRIGGANGHVVFGEISSVEVLVDHGREEHECTKLFCSICLER